MDNRLDFDHLHLDARLRAAAEDRPAFSAALYERILQSVDATCATAEPAAAVELQRAALAWSRGHLLALAASLALVAAGAWTLTNSEGWRVPAERSGTTLADGQLVEQAAAGAEHLDLLGQDAETAAQWLFGDLALVWDSADDLASDEPAPEPNDVDRQLGG